jgi:hypothetical protein
VTVTEKKHWKERIPQKIDQAIESLCAAEDPDFLPRIKQLARERALESLGLADLEKRITEIKQERNDLAEEQNHTYRKMIAAINRCGVGQVREVNAVCGDFCCPPSEIETAIQLCQGVHEKELLGETRLGKRILQLRQQKDELLDALWLAASGRQMGELWQRVTELVSQKQIDAFPD